MEIVRQRFGDIGGFAILGRLDSNTAPDFEKTLEDVLHQGARRIVIDFKDLEYISSAGLRVILKVAKELKRLDGRLVLCSMQDYVKEVFEISGFDMLISIVATRDDAIESFAAGTDGND